MTLVKCSECEREISSEAAACPHCGKPTLAQVSAQPGQGGTAIPIADAEAIAGLYRTLVSLVGTQLLLLCIIRSDEAEGAGVTPFAMLAFVAAMAVAIGLAVTAYKLTDRLGAGVPVLWALGMFLPCANILVLFALSSKAQAWCRQYGIKVGLLGPTKESIEELRRRSGS